MADDDDWDLYAVVRSCKAVTTARVSTTSTTTTINPKLHHDDDSDAAESSWMWDWLKREEEVVETHVSEVEVSSRADFLGLEELYQPFFPSTTAVQNAAISTAATDNYARSIDSIIPNSPTSFISDFVGGSSPSSGQQQLQQQQNNFLPANTKSPHFNPGFIPVRFPDHHRLTHPKLEKPEQPETSLIPMLKPVGFGGPSMPTTMLHVPQHLIRPRKRKPPVKKMVCHLTAENLSSSDLWAWRKYGQKPIKGSPHPRNYYRCSSSKGCSARKQVERSNEDPNMFVVTYCGDHTHPRPTHRNSLAGSTRNKAALTTTTTTTSNSKPESSPPSVHDDGDKASEEGEDEEIEENEDEEEFDVSSDDIFLGMKQLGRTGSGSSTLGSNSGAGFSTKQSNLGSSWGAHGCSSSAGAAVSGGF